MKIKFSLFFILSFLFFAGCLGDGQPDEVEIISEFESAEGEVDPNIQVSVYDPEKAFNGTTLFTDGHDSENFRVLEVNMEGETIWEYDVPSELIKGQPVGFDAELLENGNLLIVLSKSGVYEIDREGMIVWSYEDPKVSHDADRLANGNTLINFGNRDEKSDAQIKEVNSEGEIVWEWIANDVYGTSEFQSVDAQGWTHANAVERLSDGTTMVSLRNFFLTVLLDEEGNVVREFDWSSFGEDTDPHEPEIHEDDGTLLTCLQNDSPYVAVEMDMATEEVLWAYANRNLRTARDCDRLSNGNVLIVAVDTGGTKEDQSDDYSTIIEITPESEIVWKLDLLNFPAVKSPGFFFKAQRITE